MEKKEIKQKLDDFIDKLYLAHAHEDGKIEKNQEDILKYFITSLINKDANKLKKCDFRSIDKNRFDQIKKSFFNLSKVVTNQELFPTLIGVHVRSPFLIMRDRISYISSNFPFTFDIGKDNLMNYHKNLLKTYFSVYGRINTFNDRIFELYNLNGFDRKNYAVFSLTFLGSNEEQDELLVVNNNKNIFEIFIPNELKNNLIRGDLSEWFLFLNGKYSNSQLKEKWDCYLKVNYFFNKLYENIENTWHIEISKENSFSKWKPLITFLNLHKNTFNKRTEWDYNTREILKSILKFLQGSIFYSSFAKRKLTTVVTSIHNNNSLFAITLGNDKNNEYFIKLLTEQKSDNELLIKNIGRKLINENLFNFQINQKVDKNKLSNYFNISEDNWKKLSKIFNNFKNLLNTIYNPLLNIDNLKSAVHEGEDLTFTFYIGHQTSLTHFREAHNLSEVDIKMLKTSDKKKSSILPTILKSHYSIFTDGLTGIFIDLNNPDQKLLVKPINISSFDNKTYFDNESEDLRLLKSIPHTIFESLTDSINNLIIIQLGKGRISIYYNGKLLFAFPDKDNLKWWCPIIKKDIWTNIDSLNKLLKKCFYTNDEKINEYCINILIEAIVNISNTPGEGGMIVFEKSDDKAGEILKGLKSHLNPNKLSIWDKKRLYEFERDDLINFIIPDGATLINLNGYKAENQVQVVPINKKGKAVDLSKTTSGVQGTRHLTSKAITNIEDNKRLVITISADGPVSVFWNGKSIKPDTNFNNIEFESTNN